MLVLLVLDGAAVIATYSRFPWQQLYRVHHSGIAAGFGVSSLHSTFRLPRPRGLDAYLALLLMYGVGDLTNDDWLEQVVKRDWTNHEMPSVLTPAANWGWVAILVDALVVLRVWFRQPRRTTPAPESPAISSSV